jgi:hypothetical protein
MSTKKKPFTTVMCEVRDLERKEVIDELSMATDMNNGIKCPVPECGCTTSFKRWGDMRGHFLDDSSHKRDFFKAFIDKMKEPFCDSSGPGFNHGINSLMLALIRQPTNPSELNKETVKKGKAPETAIEAPVRPKKVRPVQEQQSLGYANSTPAEASEESFEGQSLHDLTLFEKVRTEMGAKRSSNRSPFSQISELIRDSEEINKVWRGKVWDDYVDMFHGIPPCFHCRSEEGKQIHHQNPLFHEIILVSLNKLGTTAESIVDGIDKGNKEPYNQLLQEVFAFHMKAGKVCAVPYCQECNQDAEVKRKRGRAGR